MARTKSIPKFVRDLPPAKAGKRTTTPVPTIPGLYVRTSDKGTKTFTINPRPKGSTKQMWRSLPLALDMDHLTAADEDAVRNLAREGIARGRRGEEPFPPPPPEPESVQKVAEHWLHRHVRKNKLITGHRTERHLERLVYPVLGSKRVDELKRRDIVELLDQIEDDSGAPMADHVLGILNSMFNWLEARDDDFTSPIRRGMRRTKPTERRRKRVLSDQEIRLLWPICEESGAFGGIVRLLLLTGQREEKCQKLKWKDLDPNGVWRIREKESTETIDGTREKANAKVLPLPQLVIDVIESMPRVVGNDYVFAGRLAGRYFNSFSKSKARLDKQLAAALEAEGAEFKPWVLHSLRHTAKTILSRCRVDEFTSERVLGHAVRGVAGVYGHHDHAEAKGLALEKLAAEVQRIVDPPPADGTVVDIREAVAD